MVQMKKFTLGDDWIPKKLGMFKIVFTKLDRNTELARAVVIIINDERARKIYIFMIKANKFSYFFASRSSERNGKYVLRVAIEF